nr:hypothetical protein [Candidatus Njordarchaeum guaymaensis]
MAEQERLDTLVGIIGRSRDMCPVCKELFDQITWDLMEEFEKAIVDRKRKREIVSHKGISEGTTQIV